VEDDRRRAGPFGEHIQVGGLDLAIDPAHESKAGAFGVVDQAMTDPVRRATLVRQQANQIAADETVATGDPNRHALALVQMKE
jgi:hypothetical protein